MLLEVLIQDVHLNGSALGYFGNLNKLDWLFTAFGPNIARTHPVDTRPIDADVTQNVCIASQEK